MISRYASFRGISLLILDSKSKHDISDVPNSLQISIAGHSYNLSSSIIQPPQFWQPLYHLICDKKHIRRLVVNVMELCGSLCQCLFTIGGKIIAWLRLKNSLIIFAEFRLGYVLLSFLFFIPFSQNQLKLFKTI